MYTIERGLLVFFQEIRRTHVGRQHTFFDQAVGVVALHRQNAFDFALVIENHLGFDGFKIDRAPLPSCF